MITTKEWKEFKIYILDCFMVRLRSPEYKKLMELEIKQFETVKEKHRFLWWKWESVRLPIYHEYIMRKYETQDQRMLVERKYRIPEETIEECLNWLVTKEEV